jgi:endonuclease/exonuclease/phosphatase family metal-dependent hydrolase
LSGVAQFSIHPVKNRLSHKPPILGRPFTQQTCPPPSCRYPQPREALGHFLLFATQLAAQLFAGSFTVATYNLEFYVDRPTLGTPPKSEEGKRIIRQSIRAMNPDVIALEEMGRTNALLELREQLQREALNYPYWEYVSGWDTNLHLAFLSKHPIRAARHHTRESFLHKGRRFHVGRGFGEIEVEFENKPIIFLSAHLKSKRQSAEADQEELRLQEAILLRERIDALLTQSPNANLIVLGDFNDGLGTRTYSTLLGKGATRLFDTRPNERNGDSLPNPNPRFEPRRIVWTHYYAKEELYSRIDYILLSRALERFYRPENSYVLAVKDWGAGSDHRPVCVRLEF